MYLNDGEDRLSSEEMTTALAKGGAFIDTLVQTCVDAGVAKSTIDEMCGRCELVRVIV